jgi:hypothetical protein
MKIVLMSDSHDNMPIIHKAVEWCNINDVDGVLHAGDLVSPFVNKALKNLKAPLTIVFGNNDGEKKGLSKVFENKIFEPPHETELGGKKIVMLHDPIVLDALVQSGKYDLVLYGHLHEIDIRQETSLIVNPGELSGWLTGKHTMALWNTQTDDVQIIEI